MNSEAKLKKNVDRLMTLLQKLKQYFSYLREIIFFKDFS